MHQIHFGNARLQETLHEQKVNLGRQLLKGEKISSRRLAVTQGDCPKCGQCQTGRLTPEARLMWHAARRASSSNCHPSIPSNASSCSGCRAPHSATSTAG